MRAKGVCLKSVHPHLGGRALTSTNRFILKTLVLGLVITWLVVKAAHIEFLARQHMMHFESRLGGGLFLLSSLIVLVAGVVFAWVLPLDTRVDSLSQATKMALALGLIPTVTLILRVLQWMLIVPPFNYAIRNWTMLSAAPPLWLGLTLGWWLRVWWDKRLHTE